MRYVAGRLLKWSLLFVFAIATSGCLSDSSGEGNLEIVPDAPVYDPALPEPGFDYSKAICDPMGEGSPDKTQGLVGSLHYLKSYEAPYKTALEYIENGQLVDVSLFFSHLFVPTRPFDRGFKTASGDVIQTDNGDTLYEYFGLHLESNINLNDEQTQGEYQFAILSDDGAVLKNRETGAVIIDNDGDHPTRMGCSESIVMTGDDLPVALNYYQGPRYHIALVVMMRPTPKGNRFIDPSLNIEDQLLESDVIACPDDPSSDCVQMCHVPPGNPNAAHTVTVGIPSLKAHFKNHSEPSDYLGACVTDSLCGAQGNSLFFDSTQDPPVASDEYAGLHERGWRVLNVDNSNMPAGEANPCPDQTPAPIISGFSVREVASNAVLLSWTTDSPGTTQVEVTNFFTGETFLTDLDSTLKTSHTATVTGLNTNTLYQVRAKSQSSSGEEATSDPRFFRTLP
jgi:hypothetical protein